jgi:hypothetical protein
MPSAALAEGEADTLLETTAPARTARLLWQMAEWLAPEMLAVAKVPAATVRALHALALAGVGGEVENPAATTTTTTTDGLCAPLAWLDRSPARPRPGWPDALAHAVGAHVRGAVTATGGLVTTTTAWRAVQTEALAASALSGEPLSALAIGPPPHAPDAVWATPSAAAVAATAAADPLYHRQDPLADPRAVEERRRAVWAACMDAEPQHP